jgi:lipopolysaccharide export system protein LptA
MINKIIFLIIAAVLFLPNSILYAKEDVKQITKINSKEPLEIVSDRMDAYNEKKLVVFSGNTIAKQGDIVLKSDSLMLYYKKETGKKDKIGTKEIEGVGDLEKIEAKGNISVTQGERMATGDEALYLQDSGQIIMTGNAVLREGKNIIKGDKVIVFTNENRGTVFSDSQKRVKAIIYPQEKTENKKIINDLNK